MYQGIAKCLKRFFFDESNELEEGDNNNLATSKV